MSLVIFKDAFGDDIGIDPMRLTFVETCDFNRELSTITFQLGYRGDITTREVKHSVLEIVEALNKVDPFG